MDHFWTFAGSYWWLVFPLFGMTMGAINARVKHREVTARRRHREQLELIRAQGGATAASATPLAAPTDGQQRVVAAQDAVTHRWLEYELDASKLITYPAMSDGRQPLTAAFLRAKKAADNLRPDDGETLTPERLREYRDAVTDYEVAFDVAERDARRVKDAAFTPDERKRLDTAKQLLTVATDQAATPSERQLAYKRVREELDGLILLSDEAVDVLEKKVALELPRAATAPPASAPPAETAPGSAA
ncbi:hypothetical protein DEU35_2434 [Microbacterium sp. AG157]|uniref:hypothetical protein n=1 Tax=Microbacterium TaxID=33882 RepID=UPI000E39F98D|nr:MULTISPECIES: hypothetical protein [Microbacterium]REC97939.1 hypothetical protein DEU35_2434 [Microbacterium sp. AG157]WJS91045.1 hypothetical protein NYQ11_00410 [Microbacterium testaceum]